MALNYNRYINLYFSGWLKKVINEIMHIYRFSLRDCNRYFSMYKFIYNYMNTAYLVQNKISHNLIKFVVFPTLLALKIKNLELYNDIVCGNAKEHFAHIFLSSTEFMDIINSIIEDIPEHDINIQQLLNDLYRNLFIEKFINCDTMMMNGKICIEKNNVNTLKVMLSFINDMITLS